MAKSSFEVVLKDYSADVLSEMKTAVLRALERCGLKGEGYAIGLVPVDTGTLRNSITHIVDPSAKTVYIGTNNEYAAYVELGTGIYYQGGRTDPWVYQDDKGRWHHTNGQLAKPYLKPAVANHTKTYRNIIEEELKDG